MLTVILFSSVLFTYIFIEGLLVFSKRFLRYTQKNLEYLIQNMTYQVIQIIHFISN